MASHRDDDQPGRLPPAADGSLRARWALRIAVAVSVLLIGVTALAVRLATEPAGEDPAPAALPEVWIPPPLSSVETSSPTPTPTPAPTTAPPPTFTSKPTTRPPAPSRPPVKPVLSVTQEAVPAVVDLTAQGARDWVHWGLTGPDSVNRRDGGTGEIKDLSVSSAAGRYDNNPQSFTWTGGAPTASTGPSATGLYICPAGDTFTVSVAAGPATRTLRLYAGVWMAEGRLTATLAGRKVTAGLENQRTNGTAVFVLKFKAAAGQTLRLTWANVAQFHPTCGNVDIQAATLS